MACDVTERFAGSNGLQNMSWREISCKVEHLGPIAWWL